MSGYNCIMIRTIDTDVLVLAISIYNTIQVNKLWVAFGVGKHFRYLPVHDIALFHSLTGCNTGIYYKGIFILAKNQHVSGVLCVQNSKCKGSECGVRRPTSAGSC